MDLALVNIFSPLFLQEYPVIAIINTMNNPELNLTDLVFYELCKCNIFFNFISRR